MNSGLIPHRYARALYKFACDNNNSQNVYEQMKTLISAFSADERLQKVLANPFVDLNDKRKVLLTAAGDKPGDDYQRFVTLILDHHREEYAMLMALAYRDIYRKHNKISQVKITTAAKLPDSDLAKIRKIVEKSFVDASFEYIYAIDPDLIGGFVIDVDSTRLDASISSELELLRQTLSSK